jgi:hypothetical protein
VGLLGREEVVVGFVEFAEAEVEEGRERDCYW